jgi:acyl transferase domain-containing protein/NADPH:quinone reductase-like Zn-dependent oxidoreductase/NADP-dependent 3-hydroxy acid dehydrogenase YdfG
MLNPNTMHQLSAMHMLSPEGISHTFDDRANGYGRGEGIGALIVKRLSDAIRDGDTIRAVIRGTGANADGKTPSITQPSSTAQAELIDRTYELAGLDQTETEYFESHGTGTPVGDPIELKAIASTIAAQRAAAGLSPLYVGSIKPSVGHTEGCSGLAGVFKSIVLLEKGMLAPTYGVERVNPSLKLDEWHIALPQNVMQWPSSGARRISVNSFGFGGANAHVILDDAYHYLRDRRLIGKHNTTIHEDGDSGSDSGISRGSQTPPIEPSQGPSKKLYLFSSKDQAGLKRVSDKYAAALGDVHAEKQEPEYMKNLAYTLGVRRTHLDFRGFAVADSLSTLTKQLSSGLGTAVRSKRHDDNLVMVFTGQGAQWPAMGAELLENPIFRASVEKSQAYLKEFGCAWNATEELCNTLNSKISLPEYSQTLCTVLQVALVDVLTAWGIVPRATVGHSSGEIGAAYAAALVSHEDAIKLAYVRGLSSAAVTKRGAMMAAGVGPAEAKEYLRNVPEDSAVIACVNSPSSVTLSGDVDAIDKLETIISQDGKFARKLKVNTAYHSPHMREVTNKYLSLIGTLSPKVKDENSRKTVMFSSLKGRIVSAEELDPTYWVDNMQNAVQFSDALTALLKHTQVVEGRARPVAIQWGAFIEVGPHAALQGPVQQIITASKNKPAKDAPYMSMLMRGKHAVDTSFAVAGKLWANGHAVDFHQVNQHSSAIRGSPQALADLPSYPWNHSKSFWHESYLSKSNRYPIHGRTDLLGVPEDLQNSNEPRWRNHLRIAENPWIEDHQITGTVLYPAAGMLVMALEGALRTADASRKITGFRLTDISFERGLVVPSGDESAVEVRTSLCPDKHNARSWGFTIYSTTTGTAWVKHCNGTVAIEYEKAASHIESENVDVEWQGRRQFHKKISTESAHDAVNVSDFYSHLEGIGMQYGPMFRNVVALNAVPSSRASYGDIVVPDTKSVMPAGYETEHVIHPATMDAIFHIVLAAFEGGKPVTQAAVPYHIEDMFIAYDQPKGPDARYSGYGQLVSKDPNGHEITGDLVVSDATWAEPKLVVKNFALRKVTAGTGSSSDGSLLANGIKKCARITWTEDVDFMTESRNIESLSSTKDSKSLLSAWLERVSLKTSVKNSLVILDNANDESLQTLGHLLDRQSGNVKVVASESSYESCESLLATAQVSATNKDTLETWNASTAETLSSQAFDTVIALGVSDLSKDLGSVLKLAKFAALTHEGSGLERHEILAGRKVVTCSTSTSTSLLFTSASKEEAPLPEKVVLLTPKNNTNAVTSLVSTVSGHLSALGVSVTSTELESFEPANMAGAHVISLLEVNEPLVYSWSEAEFTAFKQMVSSVKHLFWISRGGEIQNWSSGIEYAPIKGLLRVMRNEYPMALLPHLDLSTLADLESASTADIVLQTWQSTLLEGSELEYSEDKGVVHIPRATEDAGFDHELQLAVGTAPPVSSTLGQTNEPLIADAQIAQGYLWSPDSQAALPLGVDEVEIKVEYAGLRQDKDSQTACHAYGSITRRGEAVTEHSVGERVVVFTPAQTARTHIRQHKSLVSTVPSDLRPQEAVALVGPFVTAQYVLLRVARLRYGSTMLLDDAGSAVGQCMIQIAKALNVRTLALVNDAVQKDILVRHLQVPSEDIYDAQRSNFVHAISTITSGLGVDVVVCSQHGEHADKAQSVLSDFGSFIDLRDDASGARLPILKTNATVSRVDMAAVMEKQANAIGTFFRDTFWRFNELKSPLPLREITLDQFTPANADATGDEFNGSQVIAFGLDSALLLPAPAAPRLQLDPNEAYVLAGGLGALGLVIADWMVDYGAKHLVFLSRSGGGSKQKELQGFEARGVKADAFACNVNDAAHVARVFADLRSQGKRVGGVVQCAMVLEDTIFDNMSHGQWRRAIEPKTRGSRNLLANLWPGDNPFFILLSSITGIIGNTAQANYASGNTFEDAMALHARANLGIRATSIDVGLVSDSSHFTSAGEFGDLNSYLGKYQHGWHGLQTDLDEVGVAMRAIMRGSTANGQAIPAQVVLGLGDDIKRDRNLGGFAMDKKFELRAIDVDDQVGAGGEQKRSVASRLSEASTMGEAAAAVEESIKGMVSAAIGVQPEEVDAQKPLFDYGGKSRNSPALMTTD